jgi:hypothetical protein
VSFLQAFEEDEADAEYREKEALALAMQEAAITDVKSFTQASSRAAVAATAAATAVAVTKARVLMSDTCALSIVGSTEGAILFHIPELVGQWLASKACCAHLAPLPVVH